MTLFFGDDMRKPSPPTAADRSAARERVATERWMRLADVISTTQLGRSTIYKLVNERLFPKPFRIPGTSSARWREAEVSAWMADVDGRAAARTMDEQEAPVVQVADMIAKEGGNGSMSRLRRR